MSLVPTETNGYNLGSRQEHQQYYDLFDELMWRVEEGIDEKSVAFDALKLAAESPADVHSLIYAIDSDISAPLGALGLSNLLNPGA